MGSLFDRAQQAVCIQGAYSRFNKNDLRLWTNLYRCWRLVRRRSEILLKTEVWSNLIFLGFIACAARYSMWTMAVETIGPDRTALYLYLVPVICLVCSYLILGENLTAWSAAGTFLVLFGLILSQLDSSSLKKRIRKASEIS